MKNKIIEISEKLKNDTISDLEAQNLLLNVFNERTFGMVRWFSNEYDDVACVSIEKAEEYVEKYNNLSGKSDCYVDRDVFYLLKDD